MSFRKKPARACVVAFPSDVHANSTVGVNPDYFERDDGNIHANGKVGRWHKASWDDSWDRIYALKTKHDAELVTVVVGEALDDLYHSKTQLVATNKADVLKIGAAVWENPRGMSEKFIVLRSTEAHSGRSASYDELLARDLEATPDEDAGTCSWWYWRGDIGGLLFDAAHHPQTKGRLPHTQQPAAGRQSHIIETLAGRAKEPVPDVAVRGHVHYAADSGVYTKPRTFYCRAWQLTTAFGHKVTEMGAYVLPVGTLVLLVKDGNVTVVNPDKPPSHYSRPKKPIWKWIPQRR